MKPSERLAAMKPAPKRLPPKWLMMTIFVITFPFGVVFVIASVVAQETWRALRSIYLELRIEAASVRGVIRKIKEHSNDK